jgi:pyruvate/2-oxoglutarate dehydrogenase complex dihydrolipoamide acyltransferase (E2) component
MNNIIEITVPLENVNDDRVIVSEFLVEDRSTVSADTELVSLETSKAAVVVTAPAAGYVRFLVKEGDEVPVGAVLAIVAETKDALAAYQPQTIATERQPPETAAASPVQKPDNRASENADIPAEAAKPSLPLRITKAAEEMLLAQGLSAAGLKGLIRTQDILKKISVETTDTTPSPEKASMLPRKQDKRKKTEIRFLSAANADAIVSQVSVLVPARGFFKKAANDPELAKQFSARIVFEVSRLLQKYPDLQSLYENGDLLQYAETNIGYALCIDQGLKVPVFRNCNKLSLDEIIGQKDLFIEKYVSNSLLSEDIAGGTFTITDLSSTGCWLFNPVLNYRQSCILGVGGENPQGWPLILAFDHRVTDGMTAAAFLNDLKHRLYSHECLLDDDEDGANKKQNNKQEKQEIDNYRRPAEDNREKETPFCSKCYRDIEELNAMDHYLVQTINRNGAIELVCTICMEGW